MKKHAPTKKFVLADMELWPRTLANHLLLIWPVPTTPLGYLPGILITIQLSPIPLLINKDCTNRLWLLEARRL